VKGRGTEELKAKPDAQFLASEVLIKSVENRYYYGYYHVIIIGKRDCIHYLTVGDDL